MPWGEKLDFENQENEYPGVVKNSHKKNSWSEEIPVHGLNKIDDGSRM